MVEGMIEGKQNPYICAATDLRNLLMWLHVHDITNLYMSSVWF